METSVQFRTNLDCCKKFMNNISGLPLSLINPLVGDRILVYHDSSFDLYMNVVERTWHMENGSVKNLVCELHMSGGFESISQLQKTLSEHGFTWY